MQYAKHQSLDSFLCNQPGKVLERPVPGLFCISRITATGKLPAFEVVAEAFTANTFARAGLIAAITGCEVFFFLALHGRLLSIAQFKFNNSNIRMVLKTMDFISIMKLRVDQKSFIE